VVFLFKADSIMSFFKKFFTSEKKETLDKGLDKTRSSVFEKITRAVAGKSKLDDDVLDEIEEALITSDVGLDTTVKIIEALEERVARDKVMGETEMMDMLYAIISELMQHTGGAWEDFELPKTEGPYVLMVVGVNGVGKTTTIGKLTHQFKAKGYKVVLGAADTFRAAAIDQLAVWGERNDVPVIKQEMGSDPASVAYDTIQHAVSAGADLCIIDTAGRLHNKKNLMNELSKVKRVMQKVVPDAPHEILLVLDGSTGQNALNQAKAFSEATQITSLAVTKLDGTAKGGVVIGIADQLSVPVKFIGVGEGIEDLQLFNPEAFASSLFQK
jgi:fused signal recognition particle receptor